MESLFNNKYKIIKELGSGGMGKVYLVENVALNNEWAIKKIKKDENNKYDFLAEPNILKKLNHNAIPRIVDIEEDEEFIYIVEDYVKGVPLDKELEKVGVFSEEIVVKWAVELCDILGYLHGQKPNPIIYRDMKPANLIISEDGSLKLVDFGIAREYKINNPGDTVYIGTRGYASPEQYGKGQTDARTDIYSLGITLYHLLSGINPNEYQCEYKPLRQIDKKFSEGIEHIIDKCIQSNPNDRYQNIFDLQNDLKNINYFNSFYKEKIVLNQIMFFIKAGCSFLGILLIINGVDNFFKSFVGVVTFIVFLGIVVVEFGKKKEIEQNILAKAIDKTEEISSESSKPLYDIYSGSNNSNDKSTVIMNEKDYKTIIMDKKDVVVSEIKNATSSMKNNKWYGFLVGLVVLCLILLFSPNKSVEKAPSVPVVSIELIEKGIYRGSLYSSSVDAYFKATLVVLNAFNGKDGVRATLNILPYDFEKFAMKFYCEGEIYMGEDSKVYFVSSELYNSSYAPNNDGIFEITQGNNKELNFISKNTSICLYYEQTQEYTEWMNNSVPSNKEYLTNLEPVDKKNIVLYSAHSPNKFMLEDGTKSSDGIFLTPDVSSGYITYSLGEKYKEMSFYLCRTYSRYHTDGTLAIIADDEEIKRGRVIDEINGETFTVNVEGVDMLTIKIYSDDSGVFGECNYSLSNIILK